MSGKKGSARRGEDKARGKDGRSILVHTFID